MPATPARSVPDLVFAAAHERPAFSPEPGLTRRVLANNDQLMLVENQMEPGWAGTLRTRAAMRPTKT